MSGVFGANLPRSQAILVGQNQLLEMIATGVDLPDILERLVCLIEAQSNNAVCSILILNDDGVGFRYRVAQSLPQSYYQLIENVEIATSLVCEKRTIVTDILGDSSWQLLKKLDLEDQIRAGFWQPICSPTGKVLGSLAMYYSTPQSPQPEDLELMDLATHLVEIALKRQEHEEILKRYQILSQQARDLVLFIRRDGRIIDANQAALQAYGYEREELLALTIHDLRAVETQNAVANQMAQADDAGLLFETLHRRQDGTTFPVEVSSQGSDIGGERVLVSIIRDISSRKQAEAQLKIKIRQQAALSQLSQHALADADFHRLIEEAVILIQQTLGLESAAILEFLPSKGAFMVQAGVGWQSGVVGEVMVGAGTCSPAGYTLLSQQPVIVEDWDLETRFSHVASLQQHGIASSLSVMIGDAQGLNSAANPALKHPYGVIEVHSTQKRRFTPDDIGFIQAIANILGTARERHQAEERLRTSEERLRLSLEAGKMGIWDWNIQTNELAWSDNLEPLHGFEPGTFGGTFADYLEVVHPEERELLTQAVNQAIQEKSNYAIELRILRPCDGKISWMSGKGQVFCNERGEAVRMIGVGMDITEAKQLEATRQQTAEELRKSKEQLEIILQGVADGITVQDATGVVYANDAAARLVGYASVEAFLAAPITEVMAKFEVMDEWGQPFPFNQLPGRLAFMGKQTQEILLRYRIRETKENRWSLVKATPVLDESGQVQFAINIFHDITERKQVEESQRFLAEASGILATSLDYQTTLENLAHLTVPSLADWCAVDMLAEDWEIARLAVVHSDSSKVAWAQEINERYPPDPNAPQGLYDVLRTGKSQLLAEITDALLVATAKDAEHLEILRELGFSSAMIVPLTARGRTLGAITFVCAESGRQFNQADLAFAEELAHRAALAVDNARLYTEAQEKQEAISRYATRLQVLADASGIFTTASLEVQTILDTVVKHTSQLLGDACAIRLVSDDEQWLNPVAVHHVNSEALLVIREMLASTPHRVNEGLGGRVMQTGEPLLIPVVNQDDLRASIKPQYHAYLDRFSLHSVIIVPLRVQGRRIGVLTLGRDRSEMPYTLEDQLFLQDLADRAALAISNARLYQAAQQELAERKRVEKALVKRASELSHLTTILAQTNTTLEKRNQELDRFAYVVSHDLKAPLRAIGNLSEWIEEDLEGQLTAETQRQMNLLRGRVHRMEALINGLLQYSRVGRMKIEREPVEVQDLLLDTLDSIAPPATFSIAIQPGMPMLITERVPLEQVFANLISNAIKHHHRKDGQIKIAWQDKGDTYEFSVSDDGPGISPEFHEKVFGIFETLKPRDELESTGVGLAIVKKIVEEKGGTMCLESEEGRGARFSFTWSKELGV